MHLHILIFVDYCKFTQVLVINLSLTKDQLAFQNVDHY